MLFVFCLVLVTKIELRALRSCSSTIRLNLVALEIDLSAVVARSSTATGLVQTLERRAGGAFQNEAGGVSKTKTQHVGNKNTFPKHGCQV